MPIGVLSSYNILPIILKLLVITLELFLGFSDFYYYNRCLLCRDIVLRYILAMLQ